MAEAAAPTPEEKARYDTLRKELMQAIPRKRAIDKQLAQIEVQIYNLEGNYLTETATHSSGNIIIGFDGFLKNQNNTRRKYEVSDQDRIFSSSSMTYTKSLELMGDGEESTATNDDYTKQPTPGVTTVVVPPAKGQELSMAQAKRLKDKEYQRKKRASASVRSQTGNSDDEAASSVGSRRPTKRARLAEEE